MKLALILNIIEPHIGGVLILGHRGTGKSTAVRALADLLPPIRKAKGCQYGCDPDCPAELCDDCLARRNGGSRLASERGPVPVVDLPLGATEDRVCGTLDIEFALRNGAKRFEPGLLARAHRGFLYIDEVNLLEDYLVDLLLDVAASGRNVVEREGISVSHPARFVLVGSGNPDEGELRPQLLDRFGFCTRIATIADVEARVAIVQRREKFERDPAGFCAGVEPEQARLRGRISRARQLLPRVGMNHELLCRVAGLCLQLDIDGHRGELTIVRAAKALAAFDGCKQVTEDHVRRVAGISLWHRMRKDVLRDVEPGAGIGQAIDRIFPSTVRTALRAVGGA